MKYELVKITAENLASHPQAICYLNPAQASYGIKVKWLQHRQQEGLTILLLYPEREKQPQAFIEYVPGEYAWRAVSAKGYMFIHCIWVTSRQYRNRGLGSLLLDACWKEAVSKGMKGAAALCSSGPFMAGPGLFLKNGFSTVEKAPPGYELMLKQSEPSPPPRFNDWQKALGSIKGLNIIYSNQCPWVARFVSELGDFARQKGLNLSVTELKSASEAQKAPSPYAAFNLVLDGRLLADHYISMTRFGNILKKEKLI